MSRYSLAAIIAAAAALVVKNARGHEEAGSGTDTDYPWSYLPVVLPTPLSDMSVDMLPLRGNNSSSKPSIILTGGCDSADGNVYYEADWGEGFACSSVTSKVYAFDPIRNSTTASWTGTFTTLPDMPRPRNRHASSVLNGWLCVFGGRNASDALIAEIDCYDAANDAWSTPASLPAERLASDFTAFSDDASNVVYLVAGYDSDYTALDTVTMVHMSDDMDVVSFSDGPSLHEKRGDIDSAVVDSRYVYISGGFTHLNNYSNPLDTVEMFDVKTKSGWRYVDALDQESGDKQLVSLNGKIYALGGEDKVNVSGIAVEELPDLGARSEVLDAVEVLHPEDVAPVWEDPHADMPTELFRFAAAAWKDDDESEQQHPHDHGYIFVLGGQVGYDAECKCFRTTDRAMVMDVSLVEDHDVPSSSGAASPLLLLARTSGSSTAAVLLGLFLGRFFV